MSDDKPEAKPKIPLWTWPFVVVCAAVPLVTMGGALPAAIGGGCAGACLGIARKPEWPVGMRVALCVLVTVACWGVVGGLILALAPA